MPAELSWGGGQVDEDHLLATCGRVRWFMAGMGATAMVSRQGWAAGSCPAAPRHGVPSLAVAAGFFFCLVSVVQRNPAHSMPGSEGMSTAADWAGSVDRAQLSARSHE